MKLTLTMLSQLSISFTSLLAMADKKITSLFFFTFLLGFNTYSSVLPYIASFSKPYYEKIYWKFDAQTIRNCDNSQQIQVPADLIGTYTGTAKMNVIDDAPKSWSSFANEVYMNMTIVLDQNGISRMGLAPDPLKSRVGQNFQFHNLEEMINAGTCAYRGYDEKHGYYIALQDLKIGARVQNRQFTYRIFAKPNNGHIDFSFSTGFSMHAIVPIFYVLAPVKLDSSKIDSSNFYFENLPLKKYIYPTAH